MPILKTENPMMCAVKLIEKRRRQELISLPG